MPSVQFGAYDQLEEGKSQWISRASLQEIMTYHFLQSSEEEITTANEGFDFLQKVAGGEGVAKLAALLGSGVSPAVDNSRSVNYRLLVQ